MERRIVAEPIDVEERDGSMPTIRGMAATFHSESRDLGGFREVIHPEAFDAVLNRDSGRADVVALWNHDNNQLLGRTSSGTLRLHTDERGLHYEIDPPATTLARDLMTMVRRGDVFGSSFAFTVEDETWNDEGEVPIRTVRKVGGLFDVSLVTNPAYLDTDVAVRSLHAWQATKQEKGPERMPAPVYTPSPGFVKLVSLANVRAWEATRRLS